MNSREKSTLTSLNKEQEFRDIIMKLTLDKRLSASEANYILSVALIFLKEYENDLKAKAYFEFAYYIILKYSLIHKDVRPLNDLSLNYGFFPIAKFIHDKRLLESESIINSLYAIALDTYAQKGYTETESQFIARKNILSSDSNSISYVAPTSFGKSRIIFEHLSKNLNYLKIGIIVPTKSLISQTTKEVRKMSYKRKILSHDAMYSKEKSFVAVLTQERALRLLQKHGISFDLIYIDEAHNLFSDDERNILLQRLIKLNYTRNNSQKIVYLSPLIANSDNLKFNENQIIDEQRIVFNIKEPEMFRVDKSGQISKYNRFVNQFYDIGTQNNFLNYIHHNSALKNFIYLRNPRKIEDFAKQLCGSLPKIEITKEIKELLYILEKYVHEDFYIKKYIEHGVVYLHGKIPDHIKDYIEYKFSTTSTIKYLVANSVILEGINLPIDSLFIMHYYGLDQKKLTNLIGRVNRLNLVFDKVTGNLNKLLPKIHFVDSEYSKSTSSISKMQSLRSRYFMDVINNPTLLCFDIDKLHINRNDSERKIEKIKQIQKNEQLLYVQPKTKLDYLKAILITNGIQNIIKLDNSIIEVLQMRVDEVRSSEEFKNGNVIDKIYILFIKDVETNVTDFELKRLKDAKARKFYSGFLKARKLSLKSQVKSQLAYFHNQRDTEKEYYYYMGESYGDLKRLSDNYENSKEVYIDLREKSNIELVNLSVVKIKLEEDFISFKLRKCIEVLYELDLLNDEDYNTAVFGTNDTHKIKLHKLGLNSTVLSQLEADNQIQYFYLDEYSNLKYKDEFNNYKECLDDYVKYEIDKLVL